MKNKAAGSIMVLLACVLALVGVITYTQVMYKTTPVFVTLIIAIALVVVSMVVKNKVLTAWTPILVAILMGFGLATSFSVMVNQIGYVISGLDQINTLYSFIAFAVITGLGLIFAIVSGFLKQTKDEV